MLFDCQSINEHRNRRDYLLIWEAVRIRMRRNSGNGDEKILVISSASGCTVVSSDGVDHRL